MTSDYTSKGATNFVALWKQLNANANISERDKRDKRDMPEPSEKLPIKTRNGSETKRGSCRVDFQERDKKEQLRDIDLQDSNAFLEDCRGVAEVACLESEGGSNAAKLYDYEERIAIMMFDGGVSEEEAREMVLQEVEKRDSS